MAGYHFSGLVTLHPVRQLGGLASGSDSFHSIKLTIRQNEQLLAGFCLSFVVLVCVKYKYLL